MKPQDQRLQQLRLLIAGRHKLSGEHMVKWIEDVARLVVDIDHAAVKGELPREWRHNGN